MTADSARSEMPADSETPDWELFPHGADVGVRGYGRRKTEAFEHAASAMTAAVTDPARVVPREAVAIACAAPEDGLLLSEWLNALVFEMATRGMLFSRFEVRIDGGELAGVAWGEPVDAARHEPAIEVKGATLTALEVAHQADGRWVAQCVVDV